jgi:hypothetical protein
VPAILVMGKFARPGPRRDAFCRSCLIRAAGRRAARIAVRMQCLAANLQVDKGGGTVENTARLILLVPVLLGVTIRSTPIRFSLSCACAFLYLTLCGCSGRILTINIINHGPPLQSVTIHYPLFGARTLTAGALPTGGEISRSIYFRQNGNVYWSYQTHDGRDMMAGDNLFLNAQDSGLILNIVDAGGAVRTMTSGLKRSSASAAQNHPAPYAPPPPRKTPTPKQNNHR